MQHNEFKLAEYTGFNHYRNDLQTSCNDMTYMIDTRIVCVYMGEQVMCLA